eukprot:8288318-Ditylum_brightwellii.AAC.1
MIAGTNENDKLDIGMDSKDENHTYGRLVVVSCSALDTHPDQQEGVNHVKAESIIHCWSRPL